MADMNGYALIRTIRTLAGKTGRRIPAIALTVYATSKERDDAMAAGFDRHIVKPIDPERVAHGAGAPSSASAGNADYRS
jgi:CheY-like chemotaxis protein